MTRALARINYEIKYNRRGTASAYKHDGLKVQFPHTGNELHHSTRNGSKGGTESHNTKFLQFTLPTPPRVKNLKHSFTHLLKQTF